MLLTTDLIKNLERDRPLIGRAAPNFRPKRDREPVKPVSRRDDREQEEERSARRDQGEELDCYV